jgi:DNA-binding CsgD family transcriptional regulator
MTDSIQLDSVTFIEHDSSYHELFNKATGLKDDDIWRTTVIIPLLPNYFGALSLQIKISDEASSKEYFDALRSVINLYLMLDSKATRAPRERARIRKENRNGPNLTERQELVLELIQEGKTNRTIALSMGYSESLIRQETMVIYRKLGIEGRRDLNMKIPDSSSSSDDDKGG